VRSSPSARLLRIKPSARFCLPMTPSSAGDSQADDSGEERREEPGHHAAGGAAKPLRDHLARSASSVDAWPTSDSNSWMAKAFSPIAAVRRRRYTAATVAAPIRRVLPTMTQPDLPMLHGVILDRRSEA
jgi:hypothetical protein